MTYISPLHIISHFNSEDDPEINLNKLQKKILAEFNLQRSATISIKGQEYSKDQLLKMLDELKESTFPGHLAIYNVPLVLSFFENPKTIPDREILLLFFEFNKSSSSFDFFTEQFTKSLYEHFKHFLSSHTYSILIPSLPFGDPLREDQRSLLNNLIAKHLRDLQRSVKEISASTDLAYEDQLQLKKDLSFISEELFAEFLNSLPEEFNELIAELTYYIFLCIKHVYDNYAFSQEFIYNLGKALSDVKHMDPWTSHELFEFNNVLRAATWKPYVSSPPETYIERPLDNFTGKKMMLRYWLIIGTLFASSYFVTEYPTLRLIILCTCGVTFFTSLVFGFNSRDPD